MRFDFTDLRLFLAVADAGSITHGAADVGLSLAAASDRLREIEATGQVRLMERGRRGVALTEAGEAFSHHAREILNQAARMRGELSLYAKGVRATVRIVANTAAMVEALPTQLSLWLAAHPQVDVDLRERQSHEIARSVAAGFSDIGVLSDAASNDELILKPFAISRLAVVFAKSHRLAVEKEVRFPQIGGEYFVGLERGALQDHIDAQADRLAIKLRYRIRLRTFESICSAAGAGVGVAIVPETVARRCKRTHTLSVVPLADAWARRHLSVCIAASRDVSPVARNLFDHLASA
ncbi:MULTISPECIES: LysR family transcriptional regulator [unclassified Rhizobium]|uniref:LysR family transcriptional regulator n=1 Tax=unclassified Rhizobium TaxID=2613769 RepID=UPI001ADB3733|nr:MULTISPECIES: LysR family transcriptional regulator [unclassified Rhizobium]MBO9096843.1 LysR family transcriptional regulator [Rhizobium sp. L58/93]QXZ87364.1 LysR family transcriptional regulator [Rhizobium sp. K1/93]QXZ92604.1 LysR family transcriptional regulator [Rhizobium sp. K15/93]QYA04174.1 LysR family transcriptional regulator [Rhizobium sp. B21/90]